MKIWSLHNISNPFLYPTVINMKNICNMLNMERIKGTVLLGEEVIIILHN